MGIQNFPVSLQPIIQQGFLEGANVNAVQEMTSLITAQRAYEMNSKVITAADQMLQETSQLGQ